MKSKSALTALIFCLVIFANYIFHMFSFYWIIAIVAFFAAIAFSIKVARKPTSAESEKLLLFAIIGCGFYYVVIYIIGFFVGFTGNPYSSLIWNIILNLLSAFVLIISSEVLRYRLRNNLKNSELLKFILYIAFIALDLSISSKTNDIGKFWTENYIFVGIVPVITKNVLLFYFADYSGLYAAIAYRIMLEVVPIIMPISPAFQYELQMTIIAILPMILYYIAPQGRRKIIRRKHKRSKIHKHDKVWLEIGAFVAVALVIWSVLSGVWGFRVMTIISNSMYPDIRRGDAVVIKYIKEEEVTNLKVGQIIAFYDAKKVVVHRIIEVEISKDGLLFHTKGDNNVTVDLGSVVPADVLGTVEKKLPLIGWPHVFFNDIFH